MIQKMIDEIAVALNQGLYLVALSAALTMPDVCGKAEYPEEGVSTRYKKWYSTFVPDGNLPADSVYALRCSLLHEGNTNAKEKNDIKFQLMTNAYTQSIEIDFCIASKVVHANETSETRITVYVGYLCTAICNAASDYYNRNKEKFDFLNYSIEDMAQKLGAIGYEV